MCSILILYNILKIFESLYLKEKYDLIFTKFTHFFHFTDAYFVFTNLVFVT